MGMPIAPYDCYKAKKTRLESVTDSDTNQTETFTYNNEGQTINKSGKVYTYDTRHRLVQQGTTQYQYDATDNRLKVQELASPPITSTTATTTSLPKQIKTNKLHDTTSTAVVYTP